MFDLGEIQENTIYSTSLKVTSKKVIHYVEPSCACMSARYDKIANRIYLKYRAGILDANTLRTKKFQKIDKYVLVKYKDGTSEKIKVIGKVIPK